MAEKKKAASAPKKKAQSGKVLVDGKPVLKEGEPFVKKYGIKTQKEFDAAVKKHINYE